MKVRPGGDADVPAAGEVLTAAFERYPWTELTVDPDRRPERLQRLYEVVLGELVVPHGLLAAGPADVDRDGAAARLETSLDRNLELYQRFGFTVSTRLELEDTPCWLMRREPRSSTARS